MTDKQLSLLMEVAAALASQCEADNRHSRATSLRGRIAEAAAEAGLEIPAERESRLRPGMR